MVTGSVYMQGTYFEAVLQIKEMRCHKFPPCAKIMWLNHCALGLKICQYKKWRSLVSFNCICQATSGSSEIPVSLRLWSLLSCMMMGWKSIPICQQRLCWSDDWNCQQGHIKLAELNILTFFCALCLLLLVNLDRKHADASKQKCARFPAGMI